MIKRCLLTTIVLMVLYIIMTNSINDESFISRDNININVGKKVRMECELNNLTINENRKILWLRIEDAEIVYYSNNRIISDEHLRLSDSGTYSCQIDNNIIKLFSLNIVERPYFIIHEYSTIIRTYIGENISIICQAKGKPKPFIYWIKRIDENNQIILKNCSITSNICQLNFFNINYYYNGIYECLAKNFLGTIGRFYQIDVQFPPNVSILTNKTSYFIGDKLILECLIDANPKADIRWLYKSSYDIDHDKDLSQLFYREYFDHNHFTIDNDIWYIKQEQLNATRWKTTLFIK
ncbi:unnamed protein product, partial [Rotaria sp. Silwood1]